jgi:hypothetical protein
MDALNPLWYQTDENDELNKQFEGCIFPTGVSRGEHGTRRFYVSLNALRIKV